MSNTDSPDYQRAVTAAEGFLAQLGPTQATVTVPIAPNVVALWIFGQGDVDPLPTVIGADSEFSYPVFWAPWNGPAVPNWFSAVALVSSTLDTSATVTWGAAPSEHWYVVAETGTRFTLDAALSGTIAPTGTPTPDSAVLVAGSDGTYLRVLLTDDTGKLQTSGESFPAVYGAPGAAAPADALQVAGTDGIDLQALLTSNNGELLTIDQLLKLATAVANTAAPTDVVQVGGSDGTDLRPLAVNNTGQLLVQDETLVNSIGAPSVPPPTHPMAIMGTDGTDARIPLTDQQGILYALPSAPDTAAGDHPPNELQWASLIGQTASANIVAAPGADKRIRLFWLHAWAEDATAVYSFNCQNVGGGQLYFNRVLSPAGATFPPAELPLTGLPCETNTAVVLDWAAGQVGATVGYTIETV